MGFLPQDSQSVYLDPPCRCARCDRDLFGDESLVRQNRDFAERVLRLIVVAGFLGIAVEIAMLAWVAAQ